MESAVAKKTDFTSRAQATTAMRKFLQKYSKRFEHVNTYEDKVRILDNNISKRGDIVTVQFKGKMACCDYCESNNYIHVKYYWEIPQIGFYWLISELDRKEDLAFGYANLNDDHFAEWGYISIEELIDNNAMLDREWRPCTFEEAQKKIREYRRGLHPR